MVSHPDIARSPQELSPRHANARKAPSSPTGGNLTKSGTRFLHTTGTDNLFLGALAGNFAVTGTGNTAVGIQALTFNTTGEGNVATGYVALSANTTGSANTASGLYALANNITGNSNAGYGPFALQLTTGSSNTALGYAAGANATTGTYNVFVGSNTVGTAVDTNTMRLGLPYDSAGGVGQNRTFVAGIYGTQLTAPAHVVFVDANGQLGTLTPPSNTGTGVVTPGATPSIDPASLSERLEAQQRLIMDLLARLAVLESERAPRPQRR